jgi:hypothetical protein
LLSTEHVLHISERSAMLSIIQRCLTQQFTSFRIVDDPAVFAARVAIDNAFYMDRAEAVILRAVCAQECPPGMLLKCLSLHKHFIFTR